MLTFNDPDAVNRDRHRCLNVFSFVEQLNAASEHLISYLDHQDKKVLSTTYKELHELVDRINNSDYFDKNTRTEAASEAQPTAESVAEVEQYEERKCCTDTKVYLSLSLDVIGCSNCEIQYSCIEIQ